MLGKDVEGLVAKAGGLKPREVQFNSTKGSFSDLCGPSDRNRILFKKLAQTHKGSSQQGSSTQNMQGISNHSEDYAMVAKLPSGSRSDGGQGRQGEGEPWVSEGVQGKT
ncbi:hypothetical protein Salat_1670100 [Sesamum alatum]|uniref:Uncharacterized protein n=1 Tax=Sesamum alatum TaxID=300844 RepID=A0AAE1Y6U0_9LAMI|nr:hypothetical protein Salat_1670100 [Sesamum alatum]